MRDERLGDELIPKDYTLDKFLRDLKKGARRLEELCEEPATDEPPADSQEPPETESD